MKKTSYLWWGAGIVIVILAIYLLSNAMKSSPSGNGTANSNTSASAGNTAPAASGNPGAPVNASTSAPMKFAPQTPPPARAPQPITKTVFMTDQQKTAMGIDPNLKIQILYLLPNGKIGAYKVINKDSDILTTY